MSDVEFEIVEHIVDLGKPSEKGWKKELNLVAWNGGEPKYDIRSWNEDHTKMGKGLTLTKEELTIICEAFEN